MLVCRVKEKQLTSPDNQRLTSASITSSKDFVHVGRIFALGSLDVAARVLLNTEHLDSSFFRAQETQSQKAEVRREDCAE